MDTDVLINALERRDLELLRRLLRYKVYVPFVVLYEYLYGYAYIGKDYLKEKELVEEGFKVVYPTQEVILKAMELDVALSKAGLKVSQGDILVAATAITLNRPLATFNLKHFERFNKYGLVLIDPREL